MIRDISIRPALNGFIVQCGCQQLVFETVDKLADNLRDYLRDPDKLEKAFLASAINRKHTHPPDAPAWPPAYVIGGLDPAIHGAFPTAAHPPIFTAGGAASSGTVTAP